MHHLPRPSESRQVGNEDRMYCRIVAAPGQLSSLELLAPPSYLRSAIRCHSNYVCCLILKSYVGIILIM